MRSSDKDKKDADDTKDKSSSRKQPLKSRKRSGAGGKDDDDSVDSRGNIRGLIAYSDADEITHSEKSSFPSDEMDTTESSDEDYRKSKARKVNPRKPVAPRKAALKARKRIQKRYTSEISRKRRVVESESEEESEEEEEEEEEEESEEEDVIRRPKRIVPKKISSKKRRVVVESESEEEESEEEDSEEEESDEDDDEGMGMPGDINIHIGSFGAGGDELAERMVPKRHNLKKESQEVKKFVELVTKPLEATTIDDQIDQFKALAPEKQKNMLDALDRKPGTAEQGLMFRILSMKLPPDTQTMVLGKYHSLQALDSSSGEFFKLRNWLEKLTSVPLGIYKEIPVKMEDGIESCTAFMNRARRCLEEAIYGQEESKLQILQFIATRISNPGSRGLSLLLSGPPGIGKTSLIKNGIAKALNWPFQFISLGGDSDATTYTGHQLVYESSHAGKIANSLIAAKSMSMVLMFDELDKISTTPKGEEVQNLLIHMTDPVQNGDFEDKYLAGVPLDLSKAMLVFSGNDLNRIDKVLLDRMMVVQLQGYKDKEKLAIAENFLVPTALREVNLAEKISFSRETIEHILKNYASEETGVRELKRCIEQVTQKINMLRIFNAKDLPFYIKDFQLPFVIKKEHVELFLKKRDVVVDMSKAAMYT